MINKDTNINHNFYKCIDKNDCIKFVIDEVNNFQEKSLILTEKIKQKKLCKQDIKDWNIMWKSLEKKLFGKKFLKCVEENCNDSYLQLKDKLKNLLVASTAYETAISQDIKINGFTIEKELLKNVFHQFNRLIEKLP